MTRPPVEARRAVPGDLDDLVLLWAQAREEFGRTGRASSAAPPDQVRARLEEALAGSEVIVLVGRFEGVACGYAVLRLAPVLLVDGDTLHVEHLFVLPSARRRGVARALLLAATSIAERSGADQVMAGAPPSAREAHRFLARLGFSPLAVRRVVGTPTLRRRLAGEGQRRGLEDLLSRRRSLRARSLRAGWGGRLDASRAEPASCADEVAPAVDDEPAGPPVPVQGMAPHEGELVLPGADGEDPGAVQHIDLSGAADTDGQPPLPIGPGPSSGGLRGRAGRSRSGGRG